MSKPCCPPPDVPTSRHHHLPTHPAAFLKPAGKCSGLYQPTLQQKSFKLRPTTCYSLTGLPVDQTLGLASCLPVPKRSLVLRALKSPSSTISPSLHPRTADASDTATATPYRLLRVFTGPSVATHAHTALPHLLVRTPQQPRPQPTLLPDPTHQPHPSTAGLPPAADTAT